MAESDAEFVERMAQIYGPYKLTREPQLAHLITLARRGAAVQWRPIEEAPKDGTRVLAFSQDLSGNGLPPFISCCDWHPDAGFCTDEIREPTHWMPLPPPPAGETNDQ